MTILTENPLRFDFTPMRQRRRLLDISQKRLSALAGVHINKVNYIEKGHRLPDLRAIVMIARVLGTRLEDLFEVYDDEGSRVEFRRVRV
jgi:transcriptional regulator with XRE-family HTH domain